MLLVGGEMRDEAEWVGRGCGVSKHFFLQAVKFTDLLQPDMKVLFE
jgi:hypothetical protein